MYILFFFYTLIPSLSYQHLPIPSLSHRDLHLFSHTVWYILYLSLHTNTLSLPNNNTLSHVPTSSLSYTYILSLIHQHPLSHVPTSSLSYTNILSLIHQHPLSHTPTSLKLPLMNTHIFSLPFHRNSNLSFRLRKHPTRTFSCLRLRVA